MLVPLVYQQVHICYEVIVNGKALKNWSYPLEKWKVKQEKNWDWENKIDLRLSELR